LHVFLLRSEGWWEGNPAISPIRLDSSVILGVKMTLAVDDTLRYG